MNEFVPFVCVACGRSISSPDDVHNKACEPFLEAARLVLQFFKGDTAKAELWWRAPNPSLGTLVPIDLARMGRAEKLLLWVRQQLASNNPETTEKADA